MKKVVFALLGALAMTSIPMNVNATTACEISVQPGETKTINYDVNAAYNSNNCHVVNQGTLKITNGANIRAYDGYAVRNMGNGYIEMTGGTVKSDLHQAIWLTSGELKITGGTLLSAGGYEENIYSTANGTITVCGNYSYDSAGTVKPCISNTATAPVAATKASETITITITSSEKKTESTPAPAPAKTTPVVKSTPAPAKTTPVVSAPVAPAVTTPVETKTETEPEVKTEPIKESIAEAEENKPELPIAGVESAAENQNKALEIMIAASLILLGTASTAIIFNRIRA